MLGKSGLFLAIGVVIYGLGYGIMSASTPTGVSRTEIWIMGPDNRPCGASVWTPEAGPEAVIVIGHGVSENRGAMATIAKAFAARGYAAVTIDFWGHGRSRETFDWQRNRAQLLDWFAWAREEFPELPLAYLGHSMGGFAGTEALKQSPEIDAFVTLGALPRELSEVPTLIALGRFEELFGPDQARAVAGETGHVLVSPWSNHALEPWDPVLIGGMVDWVDDTLGRDPSGPYPWRAWFAGLVATVLGCTATFLVATGLAGLVSSAPLRSSEPLENPRRWSLNPYRGAAWILRLRQSGHRPRANHGGRALASALLFSAATVVLLSTLLDVDMFTSRLDHPARVLMWGLVSTVFFLLLCLDALALERIHFPRSRDRFLVYGLSRAIPLLLIALYMWGPGGLAFGGMLLAIVAFIGLMQALVYTLNVQASGDYRAGALASAICTAWVFCFWFPLVW